MSSDDLIDRLASRKSEFVDKAQSRVYFYIRSQNRKTCLSIVEKDGHGSGESRTHRPGFDSYIKVLTCFCTKQKYHSHELDSALSKPIVDVICSCYTELLDENSEEVKEFLFKKIAGNKVVLETALTAAMAKLTAKGLNVSQAKLAAMVHHAISQTVAHAASTKIGMAVGHGVTVVAGSTAGHFLTKMLLQAVAHHINYVVAHFLSHAAVQKAVMVAMKKICIVTVTAVVVKALAAKLGVTSAAAAAHILGGVFVGGYLTIKLLNLPEEMASNVSVGVRDTLNENFQPCLEKIFDDLMKKALDPEKLSSVLVSEMTDVGGWQKELEAGVDFSDPKLPDLEKYAKKDVGYLIGWWSKKG